MKSLFYSLLVTMCLSGSVTLAQTTSDDSNVSPDAEMLSFQNWAVRCTRQADTTKKACAMFQRLNLDTGQHILTVQLVKQVIDKDTAEIVDTAIFTVPWGVHLKRGLVIAIDGGELKQNAYERCDPQGCYAGMLLRDDLLKALKSGNEMKVSFVEPRGQAVTVPVSLVGFTAAYKAFNASQ
ncbi:MAG: invasion protein IalB [Parasphingorhabdus sp.]|jgi:invasion protein IalB